MKGMVDESKDRKQLYNSLKPRPKITSKEEVISSKISGSKRIKVEPFEDDSEPPLETSF